MMAEGEETMVGWEEMMEEVGEMRVETRGRSLGCRIRNATPTT